MLFRSVSNEAPAIHDPPNHGGSWIQKPQQKATVMLGNAGWEKKQEKRAGSLLALNRMVAKTEEWNEKSIEGRAAKISDVIVTRWSAANAGL